MGWEAFQEQPVNTSRAAEFPNLLEASLADDHPDLFKYISNVQDLVSSLRLGERRVPNTLSPFRWNMIARVMDWVPRVSQMQSALAAPNQLFHSLSQSCTHQCTGNALHPQSRRTGMHQVCARPSRMLCCFADDAGRVTNTLLMENLDLEYLAEQGQVAEAYLKAVLAEFGGVEKFRWFKFLGIACVQYLTPEQASAVSNPAPACVPCKDPSSLQDTVPCTPPHRGPCSYSVHRHPLTSWPPFTAINLLPKVVKDRFQGTCLAVKERGKWGPLHLQALAALHEGLIGRRETRMCYMRLFPSDVLLKHRLGRKVWEMYATSEADLAARSKAQAQQKQERQRAAQEAETVARELRLSAAAQAFKPSSSSTIAAAASEASPSCLHGLSCGGARPSTQKSGRVGCIPPYQ